jgi:hypothetical protein
MAKKTTQNDGMSTQNKVLMGAGIAALAAATAGAVFLYGTDAGKKKRKQIKSWTLKMQADVMDKMEKMKDVSEDAYHAVVDQVAKRYETAKNVDPIEVAAIVRDMKNHWKTIQRQLSGGKKKPARKSTSR